MMAKTVEHLHQQLIGIRWGSVTSGLVDTVQVAINNGTTELRYMATTYGDSKGITVTAYDPSTLGPIQTALREAGFNTYICSKTSIKISVPAPTREEKNKVCKHVQRLGEETKVAIRNIRKKARKAECDDDEVQTMTNGFIAQVEEMVARKVNAM